MSNTLRIATRKSPLALWQAEFVKAELEKFHSGLTVELVTMTTKGDVILDSPLSKIGGKGLFVKELEVSMLAKETDIAVHSMKDVPMDFPEGLGLQLVCARENPLDAFVSNTFNSFDELPQGAIVGTSSLRRQCQLLKVRPDLEIKVLRGNVNTRLKKLDDGEYDAIILAAAGLIRLEFEARIKHCLPAELSMPACGQGAVGIECRTDDENTIKLLQPLLDPETWIRVSAERAMNKQLNGGCQVPIAGFAVLDNDTISLEGRVGAPDGSVLLIKSGSAKLSGSLADKAKAAEQLGEQIADELLTAGADKILSALYTPE